MASVIKHSEYVYLYSSASLDTYPSNAPNSFTVDLGYPLHFEGSIDEWSVGLREIQYFCSYPNMVRGGVIEFGDLTQMRGKVEGDGYGSVEMILRIKFPAQSTFESISEIIDVINRILQSKSDVTDTGRGVNVEYVGRVTKGQLTGLKNIKLIFNKYTGKVCVYVAKSDPIIRIHGDLMDIFNIREYKRITRDEPVPAWSDYNSGMNRFESNWSITNVREWEKFNPFPEFDFDYFTAIRFKQSVQGRMANTYIFRKPAIIAPHLDATFIYTNIVVPSPVGHQQSKLLRFLPLKWSPGLQVTHEFDKTHFIPLAMNNISHISVGFYNDLGDLIPFRKNFGQTVLTLQFIRRRKLEDDYIVRKDQIISSSLY